MSVSPVVGVVLLVALTIIAAAIIAAFVLSAGQAATQGGQQNVGVEAQPATDDGNIQFRVITGEATKIRIVDNSGNVLGSESNIEPGDRVSVTPPDDTDITVVAETDGESQVVLRVTEGEIPDSITSGSNVEFVDGVTIASAQGSVTRLSGDGSISWEFVHPNLRDSNDCYPNASYTAECYWVDIDEGPNGDIYALTYQPGEMFRIDRSDGTELTYKNINDGAVVATVIEANSQGVFTGVADTDRTLLFQNNKDTGDRTAVYAFGQTPADGSTQYMEALQTGPNGDLYVGIRHGTSNGDYNATYIRVDLSSGVVWRNEVIDDTKMNNPIGASVPDDGSGAYFIAQNSVRKYNLSSGSLEWTVALDSTEPNGITYDSGLVYVSTSNGEVRVFNANDGSPHSSDPISYGWTGTADNSDTLCGDLDGALVAPTTEATASTDTVAAFTVEGEKLWETELPDARDSWSGCAANGDS